MGVIYFRDFNPFGRRVHAGAHEAAHSADGMRHAVYLSLERSFAQRNEPNSQARPPPAEAYGA
jgi:hypothetical protein